MTGVDTARHGFGRRAQAGALSLVLLLYFAAWLAVVMAGLFGGPVDYRVAGSLLLVVGGAVLMVGVPLMAVWVLASRSSLPSIRPGRRLSVFLTLSVVIIVGVVAWRGVVSPFAPVATRVDTACASLDAAGLADHWPAGTRRMSQDKTDSANDLGPYSACSWSMTVDGKSPAPYVGVSAWVMLFDGSRTSLGIADAIRNFSGDEKHAAGPVPIDNIGDEAFATGSTMSAEVMARRANVVVKVQFSLRGDSEGPDSTIATAAARDMVGRIIAGLEVR